MTEPPSGLSGASSGLPTDPTDEEVAAAVTALLAVLARRGGRRPAPALRSAWSTPAHGFRRPFTPAPGAWQSSASQLR